MDGGLFFFSLQSTCLSDLFVQTTLAAIVSTNVLEFSYQCQVCPSWFPCLEIVHVFTIETRYLHSQNRKMHMCFFFSSLPEVKSDQTSDFYVR